MNGDSLTVDSPDVLPSWKSGLLPAVTGWLWARACVALGMLLAGQTVDLLDNPGGREMIRSGLFVWDGAYYRVLAEQWYGGANPDAARFFPLYPALGRALGPLTGGSELALLIISNAAALAGALVLWRLTLEVLLHRGPSQVPADGMSEPIATRDSGWRHLRQLGSIRWRPAWSPEISEAAARRVAWMVAVFPAGFVFAFAYTESLALLLTAVALLALQRRSFAMAALAALLASVLRPVGGLLFVPIAIEAYRARPRANLLAMAAALLAPFAGLVGAFLWINASTHDLLVPWRLQQQIRGGFQDPVTRVLEPIGEILKGDFRDVYNFGFMVVLLFLGYQAVRHRQPLSWLAFAAASGVVLLSSQVTDSLGRYGLVVVPFIVAAAQWADRPWRWRTYLVGSSAAMIWLVSEAMIGRLVP